MIGGEGIAGAVVAIGGVRITLFGACADGLDADEAGGACAGVRAWAEAASPGGVAAGVDDAFEGDGTGFAVTKAAAALAKFIDGAFGSRYTGTTTAGEDTADVARIACVGGIRVWITAWSAAAHFLVVGLDASEGRLTGQAFALTAFGRQGGVGEAGPGSRDDFPTGQVTRTCGAIGIAGLQTQALVAVFDAYEAILTIEIVPLKCAACFALLHLAGAPACGLLDRASIRCDDRAIIPAAITFGLRPGATITGEEAAAEQTTKRQ